MFSLCVCAACCQCAHALWGGRFDPVTIRVSALCRGLVCMSMLLPVSVYFVVAGLTLLLSVCGHTLWGQFSV